MIISAPKPAFWQMTAARDLSMLVMGAWAGDEDRQANVVRCIGIGSMYRHDDGVGLYVAQRLRVQNVPGVSVIEHSGEGRSLMGAMSGAESIILIGAIRSGAEPGTVFTFTPAHESLPVNMFARSCHAFGLAEAVELARSLDRLPERCVIYGIEAASFEPGIGLTPDVEQAARHLIPTILRTLWEDRAAALSEARR